MNFNSLIIAIVLIVLNGFFVAAEFALVTLRGVRLDEMVNDGVPLAKMTQWLFNRLEKSLSACQLGITMASLGLGWIGEPALVHLIEPVLHWFGLSSAAIVHTTAFILAFTIITSIHLVIGEQLPKIYAIRQAEKVALWCAIPLKMFYIILFPFLAVLNSSTVWLLRLMGVHGTSEHDSIWSENEIKSVLDKSHRLGDMSKSEHRLLNAVFEFDDIICRRVMVPRNEVTIINVLESHEKALELIRSTKHSRYPICQGSLDNVIGIIHIKDLVGVSINSMDELLKTARQPKYIPEIMPISKLLRHFQTTRQLMALVVDEHGINNGIVTLENVLEKIVGPVDDEFDNYLPKIVKEKPGTFLVEGSTSISDIEKTFGIEVENKDIDTIAGLIIEHVGNVPNLSDSIVIQNVKIEVIKFKKQTISQVRMTVLKSD